jgi:hypothetical protein
MASVFSSHATSFHETSDLDDQLTQSLQASHYFHSPSLYSRLQPNGPTDLPIIDAMAKFRIGNSSHPFMEPRLMSPTGP